MDALQATFAFRGIRMAILTQVVQRMERQRVVSGATIVQQGAPATEADFMYFIEARGRSIPYLSAC